MARQYHPRQRCGRGVAAVAAALLLAAGALVAPASAHAGAPAAAPAGTQVFSDN